MESITFLFKPLGILNLKPRRLRKKWRHAHFPRMHHRDYKRIEAASGDEPRNKLNKSNGGQI